MFYFRGGFKDHMKKSWLVFIIFLIIAMFSYKHLLPLYIIIAIYFTTYFLVFPYQIYTSCKLAWAKTIELKQDFVYTFSDEGIFVRSPIGDGQASWLNMLGAYEKFGIIFLQPVNKGYWIIPKKTFIFPGQLEEFKSLITNKLGIKAHLKK